MAKKAKNNLSKVTTEQMMEELLSRGYRVVKAELFDRRHDALEQTFKKSGRVTLPLRAPLTDGMTLEIIENNLTEIIDSSVDAVSEQANDRDITINVTGGGLQTQMLFDGEKISHVISRILSNAIKFSPKGSSVDVEVNETVLPAGRRAVDGMSEARSIRIRDQGTGIPPQDLTRFFDKISETHLQILESGEKPSSFNLTMCQEIVTSHRGRLLVANHGQGGAIFTLILPVNSFGVAKASGLYIAFARSISPVTPQPVVIVASQIAGSNPAGPLIVRVWAITWRSIILTTTVIFN